MRISDWSSDVLLFRSDAAEVEQVHGSVRPHAVVAEVRVAVDDAVTVERHVPGPEHIVGDAVALLDRRKIGRASCRERVCQYVWISVVVVSLTKKKQQRQDNIQ